MESVNQLIKKYSSEGFKLFENNNLAEKIILTDTIARAVSLNKFVDVFFNSSVKCKELIIIERIVGIDDTFTNTLEFMLDHDHIRYYTPEEIIAEFSRYFFITNYSTFKEEAVYPIEKINSGMVEEEIRSIDDKVQRFIDLSVAESRIKFNKSFGEFRFIVR